MDRIKRLKEMLETNPADSFLQHALGLEMMAIGEDEAAKILFVKLLQEDENYFGTYYQLAKLLAKENKTEEAIAACEKGMIKAKEAGDQHAYNELRSAYEDLIY